MANVGYPQLGDYVAVITKPKKLFLIDRLKDFQIEMLGEADQNAPKRKVILPWSISGNAAITFQGKLNCTKYALRFWRAGIGPDVKSRYEKLHQFLKAQSCKYFVAFEYIENAIYLKSGSWPLLKMEWASGYRLNMFANKHFQNTDTMKYAADEFLEMVKTLHKLNVSHGDLQHGNIVANADDKTNTVEFKLVDYDSIYIPNSGFETIRTGINGEPNFQHPERIRQQEGRPDPTIDYFSELVIYLTFLAISENPSLWGNLPEDAKDAGLLLRKEDFADTSSSSMLKNLLQMGGPVKTLTEILIKWCKGKQYKNLDPLEKVLAKSTVGKATVSKKPVRQYTGSTSTASTTTGHRSTTTKTSPYITQQTVPPPPPPTTNVQAIPIGLKVAIGVSALGGIGLGILYAVLNVSNTIELITTAFVASLLLSGSLAVTAFWLVPEPNKAKSEYLYVPIALIITLLLTAIFRPLWSQTILMLPIGTALMTFSAKYIVKNFNQWSASVRGLLQIFGVMIGFIIVVFLIVWIIIRLL